jgi:hypothetical protein
LASPKVIFQCNEALKGRKKKNINYWKQAVALSGLGLWLQKP